MEGRGPRSGSHHLSKQIREQRRIRLGLQLQPDLPKAPIPVKGAARFPKLPAGAFVDLISTRQVLQFVETLFVKLSDFQE